MPNPSIVMAALDDKELQASINQMVANFDKGLQDMLDHTNKKVGEIQASLQKIGNTNFGAKGSNDGGISKQTKAQNEFTDAVKKSTSEIKRQGKEGEMSFDQIAAALSKARQTVSEFNTKRASGILPSSEDYKRYEQALARIVEYNDKLKQSALSRADANQWANVFDAKRVVSDLTAVDDRLKQLNKYYKEEEKQAQKTAAAIKENTQAKIENASVGQPAKSARDSYIAFMQGYKQQAEQTRRLMEEEQKAMQQRRQGVVDGFTKTIEERKARVKELSEEVAKLYKERPDGYRDAIKQRTEEMNALKQKIRELTDAQKNLADSPIGASNRYLELEKEYNRIKNIMIDTTNVQRQSTQETEKQTQSAQRYTEEIRKQAAAIRATKEWQEKGHVVVGDVNYYDKERANVSKREKQLLLSLEEQIVQAQQKETQEALVAAEAKRQQAQAAKEAAQASKGVSSYDLGIDPNISVGKQKQIASIKTASKETEYLRQQVASLLEVEEREVKSVNITTASYSELSQHLKQLQSAYNKLGADRIKKGEGIDIVNEIQRTQRAMQKLQQTMSRPVSLKDALGGSEKTLDDLAYKMHRLQSYRGGLNFKTQSDEVLRVNQKYAELQKKMDVIMERNQRMIASNNALGRSWNYMKNRLAFYVTVGAGTSFIKQLIDIRSQYEMNEKALGILLDSASRGTRIFNELSQMALVSPYTLIELSNAAKQLTAYDIAAKDVVDTTRRLADMASAVGVPVERLTYALGQIKAYGYLNSRDARMFANAGIPLVKQLADRYSELEGKMVSTADVYDRMKKKAIDYNDVMAVINKMTDEGGKFFDFQAKMAETLKVRLANLTLAWNNMLNDMGKDNQGVMTTGLKGLTVMFKHWRELYRIITTVIVAIGAYKAASMLVGIAASRAVSSTIPAWFRLANMVRTTQGNMALLGLTMRSIPFTAWVTAIATLASYFILFNNSSDDVKQKLEDIKSAFDGVRKEVETLFADAIKTDNIGTQLTKLRDMLELAETELGVTIPIRLEDVNESNIKDKLREAKRFIDDYINFSQTFSEAAADTKFNELMNDFGSKARSTYTSITESVNTVIVALENLKRTLPMSEQEKKALEELKGGQKEDESRIEYLQRLISLYEELGLIGKKETVPTITKSFWGAFFSSTTDNMEELSQQQEKTLDRLGIKNKTIFENMLKDVQGYYSSSGIAAYQFEQQVMRVAEKIDINNIPVEQRTMKLTAAINEEASQNNWNQFEKEFARQIANEKFGTTIEISDESKNAAKEDLQDWQRSMKEWAKNNGITFDVSFQTNDTEASYAKRMLQDAKDAKEIWETLGRKEKQGTGSKDATSKAYNDYLEKRKLAAAAGADLSTLDKKANTAARKAAKEAETELAKALKDELSTIEKVRSIYKDLTKEGMSHADAVAKATKGWDETVNAINRVLQKNGLKKLNLADFVGIDNPRDILKTLQAQLDALVKRGASSSEIKVLQEKIQTVSVDADKYDLTKITKGLNSELDRLKEEYELAVELDANPEMGNLFADWMGFDMSALPHTAEEYAKRMTKALNKYLTDEKSGIEIGDLLALTDDDLRMFQQRVDNKELNQVWVDNIVKKTKEARNALKKENSDIAKEWDSLIQKYAEYEYKIAQVQRNANKERKAFALKYGTKDQKERALVLTTEIDAEEDQAKKQELINQLKQLLIEIAGDDDSKLKIPAAIDKKELEEGAKISFEEFQKSPEWIVATGDLAGMTTKAIGGLIDSIESYKKKAKNLDPKQIKNINNALRKLYKQQREGNPFLVISNAIDQAKARMEDIQPALDSTMSDIIKLEKEIGDTEPTEEQAKALDKLKKKWKELYEVGQLSASDIVSGINSAIDVAVKASESFNKMAEALGGTNMTKAAKTISDITGNLQAAGQGAAAAAQISGGNGWAAAAGATIGGLTDLVTRFAEQWSGNKSQTERVKEVEDSVGELELAYIDLEHAVDKAMGTAVIGAKQAALANKQAQLESVKRQLELEKERDSKYRDSEKILSLEKQYKELFNEIQDGYTELVDTIMGTDVSSFAENLVSSMITAFKQGEDYMKVFSDKFDEMIDNMIMKSIVSRVVSSYLNKIWDAVDERINNRAKEEREAYKKTQEFSANTDVLSDDERRWNLAWDRAHEKRGNDASLWDAKREYDSITEDDIKKYVEAVKAEEKAAKTRLEAATEFTDSDIDFVMSEINETMPELGEKLKDILGQYYKFGESSDKNLSALQQGIQGITEDTAGALEAITNGISQQCYLQSDILIQIRDTVQSFDIDVQTASLSQILLQLQTNYIVMQSMHSMMEGWTTPSGQGIRVELIS